MSEKKILWLFTGYIEDNPFLKIGISSLQKFGHNVIGLGENYLIQRRPNDVGVHVISRIFRKFILFFQNHTAGAFWLFRAVYIQPDIIICTMPQALLIGWFVKKILSCRLVYYPFELYGEQTYRPLTIWGVVEKRLLSDSCLDAIITQNEERAKIYRNEREASVPPVVIQNFKKYIDVHSSNKLRSMLQVSEDTRIIIYEGMLVRGRWLDELIRSVIFLEDDMKLVLMGKRTKWWEENVTPLFSVPLIKERVVYAPWLSQNQLHEYIADADAGIIIYDDKVRNNYYCAPGKLSDYIISGVPVVAPNFPTIGPIIRKYEIGETFDGGSPEEISGAILQLLKKPRSAWKPAIEYAKKKLIWETQEETFINTILGEDHEG